MSAAAAPSSDEADDQDFQDFIKAGFRLLELCESGVLADVKTYVEEEDPPLFFQDPETGWSPLHFAAAAESVDTIDYLLEKGAVWNAVDSLGTTAGDMALSLNNKACYDSMRDAGVRKEFTLSMLGAHIGDERPGTLIQNKDDTAAGSPEAFMSSKLRFSTDANGQEVCMVDAGGEEVGVMMGWELPIMQETVKNLCTSSSTSKSVLNVGFGLGIIDGLFQSLPSPPELHVIIEAHPDVLAHMRSKGWYDKPGVVILEGKWQDYVKSYRLLSYGGFDVIYTDTFSEEYSDLQEFFEQVPDLMKGPESKFSWFNGLGATNALFYDVYTRLSVIHLEDIGLKTTWYDVEVHAEDEAIWAQSRKYYNLPFYRLPICSMNS